MWIASLPGHGDVGVPLTRDDRAAMGRVSHLGVRSDVRGRDIVAPAADMRNETGALGLYEPAG
ncbi:hypothetical protein ACFV2Q_17580 [Streptomyces sp. NPDC059650]|uniref:hypothetical protein n=1 Tax=Streptomyces sp. NPDC059650 TaxID=3346896 RepID=UPI00367875A7